MLSIIWPTLLAAAVAGSCALIWATQPSLQRNEPLRVLLIVSTLATVALGLVASIEIFGRISAFGIDDAF